MATLVKSQEQVFQSKAALLRYIIDDILLNLSHAYIVHMLIVLLRLHLHDNATHPKRIHL